MEAGFIISIIICISTAFITMLLGTVIYRGNVGLIAGYDPDKVTDKEGLAKWVGSISFLLGLYVLTLPIFVYFIQTPIVGLWVFGLLIVVAILIIGCKKYERR
jgi:hypothetical protein